MKHWLQDEVVAVAVASEYQRQCLTMDLKSWPPDHQSSAVDCRRMLKNYFRRERRPRLAAVAVVAIATVDEILSLLDEAAVSPGGSFVDGVEDVAEADRGTSVGEEIIRRGCCEVTNFSGQSRIPHRWPAPS